jgi:long-chain fatty acid transport protein
MTVHLNKGQEEMKVQTISKLIALSLIAATTLQATNGDNLIGVGAKARGMGGTGIAVSHGAESGLANPALITSVEGTEISFGGTLFMPTIKTSITYPAFGATGTEYGSDAEVNMIPEVSIAHKINDNWYIGIGMWGTAGMGTDYSKQAGNFNMVTNLQLLQFGVPIAYKAGGLSVGVTPILQYGNLDINYNFGGPVGAGLAQDFGFGYNLGFAYDFAENGVKGLTIGATYKSSIEMNYNGQLTSAIAPFRGFGVTFPLTDTLEQPAEFGIGIAYEMGQHTFAFDYKKIKWSDATGYKDFGWEDSDVYAFGYQFTEANWAVRVGYNRADSAVVEATGGTPNAAARNFFNLLGFPANAETHYTLGGTYDLSSAFSVDLAYVYSPKTTDTFSIAGLPFTAPTDTISTSHQESSLSFQLNYTF